MCHDVMMVPIRFSTLCDGCGRDRSQNTPLTLFWALPLFVCLLETLPAVRSSYVCWDMLVSSCCRFVRGSFCISVVVAFVVVVGSNNSFSVRYVG